MLATPLAIADALPAATVITRDVHYGTAERQRYDIYRFDKTPAEKSQAGAPVLLMVHGGGWRHGDKNARGVVTNKVAHWLPRGFIFISVNYRLIPDADPLEQARDVARALAHAQAQAASFGGDPGRFVLMGHSAGAHLVALLNAAPALAYEQGAKTWLGAVALDSAAFDVEKVMDMRHLPLFDKAFGKDRALWRAASPMQVLSADARPLLVVCSSKRDWPCPMAHNFAAKARPLNVQVDILEQDLSHGEINSELGLAGAYTEAVDRFLDERLAAVAAQR